MLLVIVLTYIIKRNEAQITGLPKEKRQKKPHKKAKTNNEGLAMRWL